LTLALTLAALAGVSAPSAFAACSPNQCRTDADCLSPCCAGGFCPYQPGDGPLCHHNAVTTCNTCYC
jgi:hypothetical protein